MARIEPGTLLGRVRLERVIAEGGTSTVYKGHHVHLGTDVAVKVMAPRTGHGLDDRNRFLREARVAARLDDPSIVRVHDFGERGNTCYLVMEFVQGVTLEQYLEQRTSAPSERTVCRLLRRVARALRVAHAAGLVHRDLKPANILIDSSGQLKVADFGLARSSGAPATGRDGLFNGTPAYMAPECATSGARVDQRADLYSLGVVGYELVFGRPPYDGTVRDVLEAHRAGRARFDLPTHCSSDLVAIIRHLMSPNPESRVQSAEQLLQELEHARRADDPQTAPSPSQPTDAGHEPGETRNSENFSSLVRFLEGRFGGRVSEHPEGRVVHSTARERAMVWLLLATTVGIAVAGYLTQVR